MKESGLQFRFDESVSLESICELLTVATAAVAGLHGRAEAVMDSPFTLDRALRVALVTTETPVGRSFASVLNGLIESSFGASLFSIKRVQLDAVA